MNKNFSIGSWITLNNPSIAEIMADAAYEIFNKNSEDFSGNFCIDDLVLYEDGVKDFSKYASVPFDQLMPDFFVPDDTPLPDEIKNS